MLPDHFTGCLSYLLYQKQWVRTAASEELFEILQDLKACLCKELTLPLLQNTGCPDKPRLQAAAGTPCIYKKREAHIAGGLWMEVLWKKHLSLPNFAQHEPSLFVFPLVTLLDAKCSYTPLLLLQRLKRVPGLVLESSAPWDAAVLFAGSIAAVPSLPLQLPWCTLAHKHQQVRCSQERRVAQCGVN